MHVIQIQIIGSQPVKAFGAAFQNGIVIQFGFPDFGSNKKISAVIRYDGLPDQLFRFAVGVQFRRVDMNDVIVNGGSDRGNVGFVVIIGIRLGRAADFPGAESDFVKGVIIFVLLLKF